MTAQTRATIAIILAALFWGSAGTFIKYALGSWQPITLLTAQLVGANLVLWIALLFRGYRWPRACWRRLILLGALEPGLCYALITLGLQRTSAANSAVLSGMESFFVIALAAVFLREPLGRRSVAGLAVAICGVLTLEETGRASSPGLGDVLVLIGILCAAIYVLFARTLPGHIDALVMTTHQFAAGLIVLLPFTVTEWATGHEALPVHQSAGQWATALLTGIVGFACSFLLYNRAIADLSASRSSIILNLMPVFGTISAILVLGESLTLQQGIGAALIMGSIFVFPGDPDDQPSAVDGRSDAAMPIGTSKGRDEEFRRGASAYDRYYGDPRCRPNPNLAPLAKAPFYAAKIVPGDLGTKGGLRTDGRARVLRPDGTPIPRPHPSMRVTTRPFG